MSAWILLNAALALAQPAPQSSEELAPPIRLTAEGKLRWRISSSCDRATICWEIRVAWIPWNSPSSHPTS